MKQKNNSKLIKIIDRGKYRIRIVQENEEDYKDISYLYEGIAKILYDRAKK